MYLVCDPVWCLEWSQNECPNLRFVTIDDPNPFALLTHVATSRPRQLRYVGFHPYSYGPPIQRRFRAPHSQLKQVLMSIRYIGSKARLSSEILDLAGRPSEGRFVDPFAGTGVVSREAAVRGWAVLANDLLPSASVLTRAQLSTCDEASFASFGGYKAAISLLNAAPPHFGFFSREYAPGERDAGRRYFTNENAQQIDGMRSLLSEWSRRGLLTMVERSLLLGDLIQATNAVANTAGTYGCYLRKFAPNALRPVEVLPRDLLDSREDVEVLVGDALQVDTKPEDVVYLDPPYTKRQYAAYYHILETLVAGDEPTVDGVTGLRPWRDRASDFCYKRKALSAMFELVRTMRAGRILISYSDEGHISLGDLTSALRPLGEVTVHNLGHIRRYTPNDESRANGELVREVVIELARELESGRSDRPQQELDFAPSAGFKVTA